MENRRLGSPLGVWCRVAATLAFVSVTFACVGQVAAQYPHPPELPGPRFDDPGLEAAHKLIASGRTRRGLGALRRAMGRVRARVRRATSSRPSAQVAKLRALLDTLVAGAAPTLVAADRFFFHPRVLRLLAFAAAETSHFDVARDALCELLVAGEPTAEDRDNIVYVLGRLGARGRGSCLMRTVDVDEVRP